MAATRMSALRQTPGRSWVREWQTVTVACSWSSRKNIGLPTMLLRPTITASLPLISIPDRLRISSPPYGAAQRKHARIVRVYPVHILQRRQERGDHILVEVGRQRHLDDDPVGLRVLVEPRHCAF